MKASDYLWNFCRTAEYCRDKDKDAFVISNQVQEDATVVIITKLMNAFEEYTPLREQLEGKLLIFLAFPIIFSFSSIL